ncbi:MAG: hypothetical protein ACR2QF_04945, partial [Geminicoccaceae bacterium]
GQFEAGGFHNTGQRTGDDPIRAYANLIRIWLDVLKAAAGNGDILDSILSNGQASSSDQDRQSWDSPRSAFDSAGGSNAISLQIIADGPVEADVRFFGGHHETSSLVLQDLRSRENGAPPIRDVTLIEASKGEPMRIVARVPSDQPSGLYQGLILSKRDDAPVGVLGIKVSRS